MPTPAGLQQLRQRPTVTGLRIMASLLGLSLLLSKSLMLLLAIWIQWRRMKVEACYAV